MQNNREVGSKYEDTAARYLEELDYIILERNFRCKCGEIDIIAKDCNYVVFIEVKYRKNLKYGYPREAVNYYKMNKIRQTSLYYIKRFIGHIVPIRYDVIEILNENITHIKGAF